MIIKPKFRGFICTASHPVGCEFNVIEQIEYIKEQGYIKGPKNVLVIGSSTGYGLASRIMSTFGSNASTIGIFFEKSASGKKTATPGWYNTAAFEKIAKENGYYAKSINGDAFSHEIKNKAIQLIKEDLGKVDLVVYSLAAPKRTHPDTNETFKSVLKPIGSTYESKTVDFHSGEVSNISIEPATDEEIGHTIAVMGGEDWEMWIKALKDADVLSDGAITVAYSYIGPELTHSIYREGTIGKAKDHLEKSANKINDMIKDLNAKAYISVNKALVTQASTAIPVISLYISILYKIMKEKGTHEGCIEQIYRLFKDKLYSDETITDKKRRIRLDDLEMEKDVQEQVIQLWDIVNSENVDKITDLKGYRKEFFKLFGFDIEKIDYDDDVNIEIDIDSLNE